MQNKDVALKRKLRSVSRYSYGVSLPKRFLNELGWSNKEELFLIKNLNSVLITNNREDFENNFFVYGTHLLNRGRLNLKDNHQRDVTVNVPFALFNNQVLVYFMPKEEVKRMKGKHVDNFAIKNHPKLSLEFKRLIPSLGKREFVNQEVFLDGEIEGCFVYERSGQGKVILTADSIRIGNVSLNVLANEVVPSEVETESLFNTKIKDFYDKCKIKGKQVTLGNRRGLVVSKPRKDKTVVIKFEDDRRESVPLAKVLNSLLQNDIEVRRWFQTAF